MLNNDIIYQTCDAVLTILQGKNGSHNLIKEKSCFSPICEWKCHRERESLTIAVPFFFGPATFISPFMFPQNMGTCWAGMKNVFLNYIFVNFSTRLRVFWSESIFFIMEPFMFFNLCKVIFFFFQRIQNSKLLYLIRSQWTSPFRTLLETLLKIKMQFLQLLTEVVISVRRFLLR